MGSGTRRPREKIVHDRGGGRFISQEQLAALIIPRARELLKYFDPEAAVLRSKEQKTQLKKKGQRSRRPKGAKNRESMELSIVEDYVTIAQELGREEPDLKAIGLSYLRLLPYIEGRGNDVRKT